MHLGRILLLLPIFFFTTIIHAQNSGKYLKTKSSPNGTVYFIPPLSFKAQAGKNDLELDFTYFRTTEQTPNADTVLVHGSFFASEPAEAISGAAFRLGDQVVIENMQNQSRIMYIEQVKGKWHCRFNFTISLEDFFQLLQGEEVTFEMTVNGQRQQFAPKKKWYKCMATIRPVLKLELK